MVQVNLRDINTTYLNVPVNTDLELFYCGKQDCPPMHSYSKVRNHYLIHYILDGTGTFQSPSGVYHLKKGNGFLIFPGDKTIYTADKKTPWSYCWFGFHGLNSEKYLAQVGLTRVNPIFYCEENGFIAACINEMMTCRNISLTSKFSSMANLYRIFSRLAAKSSTMQKENYAAKDIYVRKSVDFIERNFSRKINVTDLSEYIGIDRTYLYSLFKTHYALSPQEYLMRYRMGKACQLLAATDLSIQDIANSVGYEDAVVFMKAFKKLKGITPAAFRKNQEPEEENECAF